MDLTPQRPPGTSGTVAVEDWDGVVISTQEVSGQPGSGKQRPGRRPCVGTMDIGFQTSGVIQMP